MVAPVPPADLALIPPPLLRQVPGCADGTPPLGLHPLAGGGALNLTLRVDTREGRFVLRMRRDALARPGAQGRHEIACQRVAAQGGFAPRIIAADPDARWLVMDYVEGAMWRVEQLQAPEGIARLAERLAGLHALAPPALAPLDAVAIAEAQLALIGTREHSPAAALVAKVRALSAQIHAPRAACAMNHGDLNAANLVGAAPWLVDWEYAQIAHPLYDFACLLTYYPALRGHEDRLLGPSGLNDRASGELLAAHLALFDGLNRLWALAQGDAHGDPAGLVRPPSAQ